MSHHPLISIITVCYNSLPQLKVTVENVAAQSFRDYEHLIIDGNSKDGTRGYLAGIKCEGFHYISEPDRGIYDAMNKGLAMCKGEYVVFLNAGDKFHSPEILKTVAQAIRENDKPGIIYGQTELVDAEGKYIAPRHLSAPEVLTYRSFREGMLVCHQAFVVLRKIAPYYDLRYRFSADYDWCIQCLQHSRHNVMIPGVMIDYLSEGMTTANRKASLKERFRIMSYYYGFFPTLWRHLGFLKRFYSHKKKMNNALGNNKNL